MRHPPPPADAAAHKQPRSSALTEHPPAPSCVAVLCGLPGAGKTTLCRQLQAFAATKQPPAASGASVGHHADVTVRHLSFDAVEGEQRGSDPASVDGEEMLSFDPGVWQEARREAFGRLRHSLSNLTSAASDGDSAQRRLLVLLDDNMYYRSMRQQAWRVARDCGAAYLTLHIACDLEVAMERNRRREGSAVVPEDTMQRMAALLEVPWLGELGQPVLTWYSHGSGCVRLSHGADLQRPAEVGEVWAAILGAWGPSPPAPLLSQEEREALRAAGREANTASTAHSLDLRCRAAIGAVLKDLVGCDGPAKAAAAKRLNEQRKQLLAMCREALPLAGARCEGRTPRWVDELEAAEAAFAELCSELRGAASVRGLAHC